MAASGGRCGPFIEGVLCLVGTYCIDLSDPICAFVNYCSLLSGESSNLLGKSSKLKFDSQTAVASIDFGSAPVKQQLLSTSKCRLSVIGPNWVMAVGSPSTYVVRTYHFSDVCTYHISSIQCLY